MTNEKLNEIESFETACASFKKSKYILIGRSISQVLSCIAKNIKVYNIVAESILNYNFNRAYKTSIEVLGEFRLPDDNQEKIALCFCLLNAIDKNELDVTKLIEQNFSKNKEDGYILFSEKIIGTLFDSVNEIYEEDKKSIQVVTEEKKDDLPLANEIIEKIINKVDEILVNLSTTKRIKIELKNDATFELNLLREQLIKGDLVVAYGLFLGLKNTNQIFKLYKKQIYDIKVLFNYE